MTRSREAVERLVQEVRAKGHPSIQKECGTMRVLNMSQPIGLNDIYTNVNILEKLSGTRRLDIGDLLKICVSDEFERPGFGRISQDLMPGLEAIKNYSKLTVLGKPGAGKTTFLKYIALQCSSGKLHANLIPIFIKLKDFAEIESCPSLLKYIMMRLSTYGIADPQAAEQLLNAGRFFVLLDGLDEVKVTDEEQVLQEVRDFTAQFHANRFVITCRVAAREYSLEQFAEVEVADFNSEQIITFATKWFATKNILCSHRFIEKLEASHPIQELATNPLLLTLLCLVFEELADFPSNRSELYKEGLNVLLKKWDGKRNIERQQIYKKLSLQHKEDLLSQIALLAFKQGNYFFKQEEIQQHIANYICNLPDSSGDKEILQLNSEAVLKSIEMQHGLLVERAQGIYSFSHLTFQEYFTAREIAVSSDPQVLDTALKQLVSQIAQKRWHEIFLLTVGMLRSSDYLLQLMKQKVDDLVAGDLQLQAFLTWVNQKSLAVPCTYRPVTIRAFYLDLDLARVFDMVSGTLGLASSLDFDLARTLALDFDLALDRALTRALTLTRALETAFSRDRVITAVLALARVLTAVLTLALARTHTPMSTRSEATLAPSVSPLSESLQHLIEQLSNSAEDIEQFKTWWKVNSEAWTEHLRAVMIADRNLGHNWQFSEQQKQVLKQYYNANLLLVDCLNSARYITRTVREEIEENLLLPTTDTASQNLGDV